jgi:hypothetical protein
MKALNFRAVALGPDGDSARARAERCNAHWDVVRKGHKASDEAIIAAGYAGNQVDRARAEAILDNIFAWVEPLANSPAATFLAKEMRVIARKLDQTAKSAAADVVTRDVLHVASG